MKIADPKDIDRFITPDHEKRPEAKRTVYLLRLPLVYDQVALERAVAVRGGRAHSTAALLDCAEDGVNAIFGDDGDAEARAHHLEALAAYRQRLADYNDKVLGGEFDFRTAAGLAEVRAAQAANEDAAADLEPLLDAVAETYPRYAAMRADNQVYPRIFAIEAARRLLVGWENGPAPFERGKDGLVPLALLGKLHPQHVLMIGQRVQQLLQPTEAEEGNSDSPSRSSSAAATSGDTKETAKAAP